MLIASFDYQNTHFLKCVFCVCENFENMVLFVYKIKSLIWKL
jgi:hypothetical protein